MCLITQPQPTNNPPCSIETRTTRYKLWELERKLLCPVIGSCLTHRELQQIANKMRISDFENWSEYRLHVCFVSTAEVSGPVTRQVQKTLDRKYRLTVQRYAKLKTVEALHLAWLEDSQRGEIPAAFWALVTHPKVTKAQSMEAYEALHMLSHQIGAGLRADMKRLAKTETALLHEKLENHEKDHKHAQAIQTRDAKIKALLTEQQELRLQIKKIPELQQKVGQLQASRPNPKLLKNQIETLNQRSLIYEENRASDQEIIQELRCRLSEMGSRLKQAEDEVIALEGLLNFDNEQGASESQWNANIGGQTILCVGGRPNLEPQYSAVVSRCQGQLLYHDGGQEDNIKRLECMLSSADAVICPTDCVSHDAYWRTKRYCKRTGKPCVFIPRSGISSFAQGVTEIPKSGIQRLT